MEAGLSLAIVCYFTVTELTPGIHALTHLPSHGSYDTDDIQ